MELPKNAKCYLCEEKITGAWSCDTSKDGKKRYWHYLCYARSPKVNIFLTKESANRLKMFLKDLGTQTDWVWEVLRQLK